MMSQRLARSSWTLMALGAVATAAVLARPRTCRCYRGKNVVITGGSRGLGLELARRWGQEGANVAICSRDPDAVDRAVLALRALGINAIGDRCDVRNDQDCRAFLDLVRVQWGSIDVLVNNAGIIQVGPLDCMTREDVEDSLATHLWGPLNMIQVVLPEMRERRDGQIVNIASIGGRISVPHLLPYCTGKFALVGFSEGLAAELARDGISVITVTPGLMRTGSPRNAQFKGQQRAEYAWFSISDSLPGISVSSATAASRIVEACRHEVPCPSVSATSYVASACHGVLTSLFTTLLSRASVMLPGADKEGTESRAGSECTSAWSPSALTVLNERAAIQNLEVVPK